MSTSASIAAAECSSQPPLAGVHLVLACSCKQANVAAAAHMRGLVLPAGSVLGLCILAFSWVWTGISIQVGAAVAIALPVSSSGSISSPAAAPGSR